MNDQTTESKGKDLIDLTKLQLQPAELFAAGGMNDLLTRLEAEARSIAPDISTAKGRKAIASIAARVAKSKTYLDDLGKKFNAKLKEQTKAVDAERRTMRDRLDALKVEVRKPLTEFEEREAARQQAIRERIGAIRAHQEEAHFLDGTATPAQVAAQIATVEAIRVDGSFAEFQTEAFQVRDATLYRLHQVLAEAEHREEVAEEARAAEEKAQLEREERIRQEAAAKARAAAERAATEAAEKLQQEQEQRRLQREKELLDAERRALEAERKQREAEERAEQQYRSHTSSAPRDLPGSAKDHREENVNGGAEPSHPRHDQSNGNAAAQLHADTREHHAQIHNEIAAELTLCGLTVDQARAVVVSIARGAIPHVQINY